jgi:effector-binding domain-containing protein
MKKVLVILLGIIVILVIIGFVLPRNIDIVKSVNINAPAGSAFAEINDLEKWKDWSYWHNLYKDDMKITYGDVHAGTGGWYSWEGEESGNGKATVTESIPNQSVKVDLDFMEQGTAKTWYTFEPEGNGTKLTMGFSVDMGINPLMRWVGMLLMKPEMNKAHEYSLERLKAIAEAKPVYTIKISEETVEPITYIGISTTMSPKDPVAINAQMEKMFGELKGVLEKSKVEALGHPFCLFPSYSEESMEMVCALPVAPDAKLPAKYKIMQTPGGKVVVGIHEGDYSGLTNSHMQIGKFLGDKKLEEAGAPWEVYVTDPKQTPDSTQWVTKIYYPVK